MSDQPSEQRSAEDRKDKLDTLRRYETTRREQLGAAINLIFGVATAAAGFCVSQITAEHSLFSVPGTYYFLAATALFIVTVGLCMLTTWTRLKNFRMTARKLRAELRDAPEEAIAQMRSIVDKLGIRTWLLFRAQSITFFVGILLLAVALWMIYSGRLFPQVSLGPGK